MSEKLKTVVVDRATWNRGQRGANSRLKSARKEEYCCLGFCALEAGYNKRQISDRPYPDSVKERKLFRKAFPGLFNEDGENSRLCNDLMVLNDSTACSDEWREEHLAIKGKRAGIRFKFIGK